MMMDMFYTESIQHVFFLQASCITCSDLYAGYSEYLVFDASYYQVTYIADLHSKWLAQHKYSFSQALTTVLTVTVIKL